MTVAQACAAAAGSGPPHSCIRPVEGIQNTIKSGLRITLLLISTYIENKLQHRRLRHQLYLIILRCKLKQRKRYYAGGFSHAMLDRNVCVSVVVQCWHVY